MLVVLTVVVAVLEVGCDFLMLDCRLHLMRRRWNFIAARVRMLMGAVVRVGVGVHTLGHGVAGATRTCAEAEVFALI